MSTNWSNNEWDYYLDTVAGIESGGHENPYDIMGGANNHYIGKYQLGKMALTDAGYEYNPAELRANPALQESAMRSYTNKNWQYLHHKIPGFAELPRQKQMELMAYAHNQGAGGAAKWYNQGVEGKDAFGTSGTKYSGAIAANYPSEEATAEVPPVGKPPAPEAAQSSGTSFGEAFKNARAEQGPGGTFEWNGNVYTTDYKEEGRNEMKDPLYLNQGGLINWSSLLSEDPKKILDDTLQNKGPIGQAAGQIAGGESFESVATKFAMDAILPGSSQFASILFNKGGEVPQPGLNGIPPQLIPAPKGPLDEPHTDTMPAMLTPGEFVLNEEAVDMFRPIIEAMNKAGLQKRMESKDG